MSFVLNEQSVFCPQLGSASCFLGMERPEVQWGWEHPLLAPLPIISFQRTWKPELWFSLGEFVGTEALEASGMTKGGRWRGRYDILVRKESKHYQILAGSMPLSPPLLHFHPRARLSLHRPFISLLPNGSGRRILELAHVLFWATLRGGRWWRGSHSLSLAPTLPSPTVF